MQLVDDGRLADAGISRDQDQLRRAAPDDAIERGEQGFDLALSPVQQLWNQEAVRIVVLAEAEVFDPALLFPCGKAALKIALEAGRGLIAFLRRLGEQLHDDRRDDARHIFDPFGRRYRPSRNVAMYPFHRIGRCKRQRAGEHPVKCDAERVQVAAGIDRAIHPSGLFGRHIGEGAGDGFGRIGRLPFARKARCDPESRESDFARGVHQDICRFEVLVDQTASVELRERRSDGDGQT